MNNENLAKSASNMSVFVSPNSVNSKFTNDGGIQKDKAEIKTEIKQIPLDR